MARSERHRGLAALPLLARAFRPFYLLGALYAPLLAVGGIAAFAGVVDLEASAASPSRPPSPPAPNGAGKPAPRSAIPPARAAVRGPLLRVLLLVLLSFAMVTSVG